MGSNFENDIGRQMTNNTPPPSQIAQQLNVPTNVAEAIWKTATSK